MLNINANINIIRRLKKLFAFAFNGMDNVMEYNYHIFSFTEDWDLETKFSIDDYGLRGGIVAYSGATRKFLLGNAGLTSVYVQYYSDNGEFISQGLVTGGDLARHKYRISWKASEKKLTAYVDDVLIGSWDNQLMDSVADTTMFIGRRSVTEFQSMTMCYLKHNLVEFKFNEGKGNQVKEKNSGDYYTIQGSVEDEQWIKQ